MKSYKLANIIAGWAVFLFASIVYLLTMEPTVSFWDCGEFISSAFKLEVGHPPGNPVFMLMQNLFSHLAGGNVTKVAFYINSLSAISSGLTVMFLFWTITHLARRIRIKSEEDYTPVNTWLIIGAGLIGALAFTFTDSFWFSAVEGIVWSASSLLISIVFWAMLKWENVADEKGSNRWLILIAYLMGLSIGIHLLNLLALPAIVLIYYFKKYEATRKGVIIALLVAAALLIFVMYIWIRGLITVGFWFELFSVNGLGLPYYSGMLFFFALLIAGLVYGIRYTRKHNRVIGNTILIMLAVMLIGYSSYTIIVIRSSANPPMNQNNPGKLNNLLYYLSRKQYGETPLFTGPYYNAQIIDVKQGAPIYAALNGKYEEVGHYPKYVYDPDFTTVFPRMYSDESRHVQGYKYWGHIKGIPIRRTDAQGKTVTVYKPTFGENLRYFFNYQVGFMYLRYFMWNFAGRQNDIQGDGNKFEGNWISGINFIDEARLGPQDKLPNYLKNNRARNKYYMLPLLLGLVGLFFHLKKHPKDFTVIAFLFFMTGLAIVLYVNQKPYEPRERDYSYVGSFYAFAVWIGLGFLGLLDSLPKKFPLAASSVAVFLLCAVAVPGLMAEQNWDDHDRSGRYTARDFASDYLNSCAPNAILFTYGDNDTYPLWYCQEVEGIRTDIRVVNLSYLGADWYVEQMTHKQYQSDPLPISFKPYQYMGSRRDVVYLFDRMQGAVPLKDAMEFIASDDPKTKQQGNFGENVPYLPLRNFSLTIDKNQILSTGTVSQKYADRIVPEMQWKVNKNMLLKNDLMVLDILAYNNWKRPIYFAITVGPENFAGLDNYLQLDGLAYRVVPVHTPGRYPQLGYVNTDILYDNMMNKFKWGNATDPHVYLDENNLRQLNNYRNNFTQLAEALISEGKKDSALKVLNRCMEILPNDRIPPSFFTLSIVDQYFRLNQPEKAKKVAGDVVKEATSELTYFIRLGKRFPGEGDYNQRMNLYLLSEISRIAETNKQQDLKQEVDNQLKVFGMDMMPEEGK